MTTRRALAALLLATALAAPGADAAPPAPQLRDPAGDWMLPWQDIVAGRFSSVLVKGVPYLRGELTLTAPPDGVHNYYFLTFVHGCHKFQFSAFVGPDSPWPPSSHLEKRPYCFTGGLEEAEASYAATVSIRGSTVTWLARYVGGVRRGSTLSRFTAEAFTTAGGTTAHDVDVDLGDRAEGSTRVYVVGSDLPRR
ncbi:MAG TPA: hypothetical protein VNQ77_17350 [Frankiaceae bacterium]|nr:hypothetical protein [Frankiaceae bacterium]